MNLSFAKHEHREFQVKDIIEITTVTFYHALLHTRDTPSISQHHAHDQVTSHFTAVNTHVIRSQWSRTC